MSYNLQEDNPTFLMWAPIPPDCVCSDVLLGHECRIIICSVRCPYLLLKFCLMVLSFSLSFELLGSPQPLLLHHLPDSDRLLKPQSPFWMLPCFLLRLLAFTMLVGRITSPVPSLTGSQACSWTPPYPKHHFQRPILDPRRENYGVWGPGWHGFDIPCVGNDCPTHLTPQVSSPSKSKVHFIDRMFFSKPYLYFVPSLLCIFVISQFIENALRFIVRCCPYVAKCLVPSTHFLIITSSRWLPGARPDPLLQELSWYLEGPPALPHWSQLLAQECGLLTHPISKESDLKWRDIEFRCMETGPIKGESRCGGCQAAWFCRSWALAMRVYPIVRNLDAPQ